MKFLYTLFLLLFTNILFGQVDVSAIKNEIAKIQAQPDIYYFGFAEGLERKSTDQKALQELMSKIYVVVSSELTSTSISSNDESKNEDNLKKVLNTYTYGRLPDVEQLYYKTGNVFHIFRYIKKDDYRKIFENRKIEINGFLREAKENLVLNQLGKTFRNYYRAAVAIESLQEASILYQGKVYTSDIIFDEIRQIAKDIKIDLVSNSFDSDVRKIILDFSYNEKPISDLNISYYDMFDYISQKTNSNLVYIELYGKEYKEMEKLALKIDLKEEMFNSYNQETKIISSLFEMEDLEEYREVRLKKRKLPTISKKRRTNPKLNVEFINYADCPVLDVFANNLLILFSILDNEYLDDESIFTDSKIIHRVEQIINYNHTKFHNSPQKIQINKTEFGWEARQFAVSVSCSGYPKRDETVVIDFDDSGKIYNFSYTINPTLHKLFETESTAIGDWDYRQIAIKFLENYKTSYNIKNIEDIEALYSDDAIIITGKVITRTKNNDRIYSNFSNKEIIYFKRTKKEHIEAQKKLFKQNEFIWLQFDTFNINVAPIKRVYGISMKQNYYSSSYSDEGYLFLLIDFRGEKPLIHVRNWQPGEWDLSKQMKLENFRFY